MASNDSDDFRIRPGRPRSRGTRVRSRDLSFVQEVHAAIRKVGGNPNRLGRSGGSGAGRKGGGGGRFNAHGRGARALASFPRDSGGWQRDSAGRFRSRRVVVKARVVKLNPQRGSHGPKMRGTVSKAADAHLRYLERDGVTRDGEKGRAYSVQRGRFDVVLGEALDRISRDQADVATLFKHLRFAGVQIVTLAEGEISELHVGLKGTMNALFLKDLAMKTHRGLRGRVEKGKAGGGLCYGYRVVKKLDANGEPIRGDREIIAEEAATVRRIFRAFAAGKSPKAIAVELNKEGIPGPLGRAWGDTSIRGHVSRGTGILNNELYTGVLVWNRQRFVKDPATGKRVSRPNSESQWIRTEVPHLKIVDDDLWQAARVRQQEISAIFGPNPANTREGRAKRLRLANRPVSLLSGLLTCGCCGGKIGILTPSRYGCLNHHRRGTCDNNRTITREKIEARVLTGLQDRLVSSEAVAEAVRACAEEMNRLNHDRRAQAESDHRALRKIEQAIAGIMTAIEDGMYQPSMKARMDELERQKADITERLAQAPADIPDVHPNVANIYRRNVVRFTEALDDPDGGREAAQALRSLIGEIVLTPGTKHGEVQAELRGELMGILDFVKPEEIQWSSHFMPAVAACPRNRSATWA